MSDLGQIMGDPVVQAIKKLEEISNQFGGAYTFVKYGLQVLDPISNTPIAIDVLKPEVKDKYLQHAEALLLQFPAVIDAMKEAFNNSIHPKNP